MGTYRIDGPAFVYMEKDSKRIRTILGYPTRHILEESGQSGAEISNIFG
jgi:hypothetical protein